MSPAAATCRSLACCLLLAAALTACAQEPPWALDVVDLFTFRNPAQVAVSGLEGVESDDKGTWRWALGPQTAIHFVSDGPRPYTLRFALVNPIPNATIALWANGRLARAYGPLAPDRWFAPSLSDAVTIEAKAGENTVMFSYSDWNHRQTDYMPKDQRPLAAAFSELLLYAAPPAGLADRPSAPSPTDQSSVAGPGIPPPGQASLAAGGRMGGEAP